MRSQRSRIFLSFQPTRPLRGATLLTLIRFASLLYFNPRAPCGARPTRHPLIFNLITFQPTRPLRGATYINLPIDKGQLFQPTRPLRGATKHELERRLSNNISTHAPLAGRDVDDATVAGVNSDFNPRAPCGARLACLPFDTAAKDFNPRAPCGARRSLFFSMIRR